MRRICFIVQYVRVRGCVVGDASAGFAPLVHAFVLGARACVRACLLMLVRWNRWRSDLVRV